MNRDCPYCDPWGSGPVCRTHWAEGKRASLLFRKVHRGRRFNWSVIVRESLVLLGILSMLYILWVLTP